MKLSKPAAKLVRMYERWAHGLSGVIAKERHDALKAYLLDNTEAWIEAVLSGRLTELHLIRFAFLAFGGSCTRVDNPQAEPYMTLLYSHYDDLPYDLQITLDWYQRVHGWNS